MPEENVRIARHAAGDAALHHAEAVVHWVREDVAPIAATLARAWRRFQFRSYECRGRNRVIGAMLSEHGKGNAIDIRRADPCQWQELRADRHSRRQEVRERLKASACARFTTRARPARTAFTRTTCMWISPSAAAATASASGGARWLRDRSAAARAPAEAPPREP